ncbi:MAG: hypothetical protein HOP02_00680 [Methylococcaceae bacterium]|nr:hypothetical protein [Methylococcaceae bacterium]
MITAAINIGIYTIVFFLLGMYKPQWPLFFMKNPNRITIMIITIVMIMVGMTLFGEGTRRKKLLPITNIEQSTTLAVPVPAVK